MELADLWSVAKEAIIPLIGFIGMFFKQKIDGMEKEVTDLNTQYRDLEKKLVFVESTYATKAEMAQMLNQINTTLLANNNALEQKIEKIMDLKNATIQVMLEDLYKKTQITKKDD